MNPNDDDEIPAARDLALIDVTLEQWQHATPEQRQRIARNIEATKEVSRQKADQDAARAAQGRYTLAQAAELVEKGAGERKGDMTEKLRGAVQRMDLRAYEPGHNACCEYGSEASAKKVRTYYEEVYWDDLNLWLETNDPRVKYRFPAPVRRKKSIPLLNAAVDDAGMRALALDKTIDSKVREALADEILNAARAHKAHLDTQKSNAKKKGSGWREAAIAQWDERASEFDYSLPKFCENIAGTTLTTAAGGSVGVPGCRQVYKVMLGFKKSGRIKTT